MKTEARYIRSNRPKPSFFGRVFYWMWEFTPKKGLPDRSWMVVTLVQYVYLLFPIALCLQFLSDDTVRMLYETDGSLTIFPIMAVFAIMVWRNLLIYNKSKYLCFSVSHFFIVTLYARINKLKRYESTFEYIMASVGRHIYGC